MTYRLKTRSSGMDKATVYRQFIFQVQGLVAALIQFTQTYKKIMIAFWRIFAFKKGKCFEIPIIFIKTFETLQKCENQVKLKRGIKLINRRLNFNLRLYCVAQSPISTNHTISTDLSNQWLLWSKVKKRRINFLIYRLVVSPPSR